MPFMPIMKCMLNGAEGRFLDKCHFDTNNSCAYAISALQSVDTGRFISL